MSTEWSNDATTSITLPTGAVNPEQRIVLDGSTDTILVYDSAGALIASIAATAGSDGLGNNYPAGVSAAAGVISQSIFLLYNGTPALGNLIMSLSSMSGTDSFGNIYQSGFTVYDTATGNALRNIDISGLDTIGNSASSQFVIDPSNGQIRFYNSSGILTGQIVNSSGAIIFYTSTIVTNTYTSSSSFLVPAGVTSIRARCWGAGGGGRSGTVFGMSGGGGGEYAEEPNLMVTPGETLTISIGAGGTAGVNSNGGDGGPTQFLRGATPLVTAHGGIGGKSGLSAAGGSGSMNTIHNNGGSSPVSSGGNSRGGSGGGESGTTNVSGNPGLVNSGITGGAGGSGTFGFNGGNGGDGTGASGTTGSDAPTSLTAGGGGAGGFGTTSGSNGGAGGHGQAQIVYTNTAVVEVSIAAVAGTDQFGNSYPKGIQIGQSTGARIYMDPSTPAITTYTSTNNISSQWSPSNGYMTITSPPLSVISSPNTSFFTQVGPTTNSTVTAYGLVYPSLTFGAQALTNQLPSASDISSAPYIATDGFSSMMLISGNHNVITGTSVDAVGMVVQSGNPATAYTGGTSIQSNSGQPVHMLVDGQVTDSTTYYDRATIPGQVGGGTTSLTITGLGLTNGPTGVWTCLVTGDSSVPGTDLQYISYTAASSDGVTLHMNRLTNTNTIVSYMLRGI